MIQFVPFSLYKLCHIYLEVEGIKLAIGRESGDMVNQYTTFEPIIIIAIEYRKR